MNGWVPEVLWGVGTAVLLAALIYGTIQWRLRSPNADAQSETTTARNYREEEQERRREHEV